MIGEEIHINDKNLSLVICEENRVEAKDDSFGPMIRNSYVVECCTGGFGYIVINDKEFKIKEGDCYVLLPGDRVTHKTTKDSYRSELSCFIRGEEIERAVQEASITSDSPFAPKSAYYEVSRAIRRMLELDCDRSIRADYLRMAEMYRIISTLFDCKRRAEGVSVIERAIGIIDTGYAEAMSVDNIAKRIGLERCYFSVLFREHTGLSPHAYLNSVRIEKACTLMSKTNLSISEIAVQVGLEARSFSRMFKRELGLTPSEYKKSDMPRTARRDIFASQK